LSAGIFLKTPKVIKILSFNQLIATGIHISYETPNLFYAV
jgi:hypothetical protein